MADVSQIITLGIGTPSDLMHFLTTGLGSASVAEVDGVVAQAFYGITSAFRAHYSPTETRNADYSPNTVLGADNDHRP